MRVIAVSLISLVFLVAMTASAYADTIGGIEFPDGAVSFADAVYSYSPGTDVGTGYDSADAALGVPDYSGANGTSVSLGDGGVLILQFVNNSLTASGDSTADLHIFEIGSVVEWFNVAISTDATTWIDLGDVLGQPTSIDIDAVAGVTMGVLYSYVRLTDVPPNQTGSPFGEADIDAVGAISSGAPAAIVPVPGAFPLGLLGLGLVAWKLRRRGR